ncbi:MAG: hypothetical protein GF388_03410 [Candidatus Aegiribacteria sp.]|nr:hypothetical protein [Candidatus Aegiribacteria sp.]MBD3294312.1 hypothetical protein [Candidatus Fermentibacteria bacterium]
MTETLISLFVLMSFSSIPAIDELQGGDFSAVAMDIETGEFLLGTGSGTYPLASADVFFLAFNADMLQSGQIDVPREPDMEALEAWITEKGLMDTEFFPSEAVRCSTSAEDVARALVMINSGRHLPFVRRALKDFSIPERVEETFEGWGILGLADSGDDHLAFALIAVSPEENKMAAVLLSRSLCCPGKAELALTLLLEATEGL